MNSDDLTAGQIVVTHNERLDNYFVGIYTGNADDCGTEDETIYVHDVDVVHNDGSLVTVPGYGLLSSTLVTDPDVLRTFVVTYVNRRLDQAETLVRRLELELQQARATERAFTLMMEQAAADFDGLEIEGD